MSDLSFCTHVSMEINGVLFVSQSDNKLVFVNKELWAFHGLHTSGQKTAITLRPPEFHGLDPFHILTSSNLDGMKTLKLSIIMLTLIIFHRFHTYYDLHP